MKRHYFKPITKVIEITHRPNLLSGSGEKMRGGGVATDIGYGGEGDELDPD